MNKSIIIASMILAIGMVLSSMIEPLIYMNSPDRECSDEPEAVSTPF